MILPLLALGLAASLAPIWRDPSWEGGKNAWQSLKWVLTEPPKDHIPTEEALERNKSAQGNYYAY